MITMTLSKTPSQLQSEFLISSLEKTDAVILTAASISLVFHNKPFQTQAFVRKSDLAMCGGKAHDDWQVITDEQWCQLLLNATKNVTW